MYLLLTDRLPFPQLNSLPELGLAVFEQPLVPPSRYNLAVTPELDAIVGRALALNPQDRYPNAASMLAALDRWQTPSSPLTEKPDLTGRSDSMKRALGPHTPPDEGAARRLVREAEELAGQVGRLDEAADLLERAILAWPDLRENYEDRLKLWRLRIIN
jgi:serine/threonine-protein kinase